MRPRLATALAASLALLAVAAPGAARGAFGFADLDVFYSGSDGSAATQAGSHPFAMKTSFKVNSFPEGELEIPEGETRDLTLSQIEGLVGNPTATPRCSAAQFITLEGGASQCPDASAVGIAAVRAGFQPIEAGESGYLHVPVFNLTPPPGMAAKLGFVVLNEPVAIGVGVNESPPYNIVARLQEVPQVLLFYSSQVTLWGNPASPAHDGLRGACLGEIQGITDAPVSKGSCPVGIPEKPFLTMPRACQGPLETTLEATSWEGAAARDSVLTHDGSVPPNPQGMSGCESLGFAAEEVEASPTTSAAASPSGLEFEIEVSDPGLASPGGTARSDIRAIEATLPRGMTANPSAAAGLGYCTIAQYEAASIEAPGCPGASTLGTVEVETPILENRTLRGTVYLGRPDEPATPGQENPFDSLLALYVVIRDRDLGVLVKQAVRVEADPATGQLTTTVEDLPQFPLSRIRLRLREGPRAPLITPLACGAHATRVLLTPWSGGRPISTAPTFTLSSGPAGGPCPPAVAPFVPGFKAGTLSNAAGTFSPFLLRLTRQDGEQDLTKFSAVLPPGVTARLSGIPWCPDAAIARATDRGGRDELASPSCPAPSQVGRVLAGAGAGAALTYVEGSLHLSGPYNGAPLSVVAIVPAVAGPFDVGTVVTRVGLRLNPVTGQGEVDGAASDPIPHILEGIPLKVRDIRVLADRPGFTLNPTSCAPSHTFATIWGGGSHPFSPADDRPFGIASRFQAASCAALQFKPKLAIKLRGGVKRGAHPALRAIVTPPPRQANFARAVVTLPRSAFLEQAHIRTICTRVQFAAGPGHGALCPKGAQYGFARAWSPLLDAPAQGPVFLRSSDNNLPDLVVALKGPASAPVDVELSSRIDSVRGGIRSTFTGIPDLPVSRFILDMQGGKKGLIVNSRHLCHKPKRNRAKSNLTGQNGARHNTRPRVIAVTCQKRRKAKRKRAKRSAQRRAHLSRASAVGGER